MGNEGGEEYMDWAGDILGALASAASGGLFGLLGSLIGVGAKWLQERQRQAWERAKWDHEDKMLRLQMDARAAETEQELAIVSQQGSWAGMTASQQADATASGNVHTWVNDVRSLFRPALTVGLVVLCYVVFRDLMNALANRDSLLGAILVEAEVKDLIRYMVYSVFFAGSTSVVWWYGDRAMTPPVLRSK